MIIWDVRTGELLKRLDLHITDFAISQTDLLAYANKSEKVGLLGIKEMEIIGSLTHSVGDVAHIKFSPDGRTLALASGRGPSKPSKRWAIEIWNSDNRNCVFTFKDDKSYLDDDSWECVDHIMFHRSGNYFLASVSTGNSNATIKIWDLRRGGVHCEFRCRDSKQAKFMLFTKDCRFLVTGCAKSGTVEVWDFAKSELFKSFEGAAGVDSLAYLPNSNCLVAVYGPYGKHVKLLDINGTSNRDTRIAYFEEMPSGLKRICVSPDGKTFAAFSRDLDSFQLWDTDSGALRATLPDKSHYSLRLAFSPNSKLIASTTGTCESLKLWDPGLSASKSQEEQQVEVLATAVSPDGKLIAAKTAEIDVWEVEKEGKSRVLPSSSFSCMVISPQSRFLVTKDSAEFTIWDLETSDSRETVQNGFHYGLAGFLPTQEQIVVSTLGQGRIGLWDPQSRELVRQFEIPVRDVILNFASCIRPEGNVVFAASTQATKRVFVWDSIHQLENPKELVLPYRATGIALSPNEDILVTVDTDATVQVWNSSTLTRKDKFTAFRLPSAVTDLSFCTNGCCIRSKTGVFSLANRLRGPLSDFCEEHYPIFYDETWLLWRGKRFLWLPLELRHNESVVNRRTVAIPLRTGRILFLKFDPTRLDEIFQQDKLQGASCEVDDVD